MKLNFSLSKNYWFVDYGLKNNFDGYYTKTHEFIILKILKLNFVHGGFMKFQKIITKLNCLTNLNVKLSILKNHHYLNKIMNYF